MIVLTHFLSTGGIKTRFWSAPRWPSFVRDRVWQTLYELETDYLDADDIEAIAAL